MKHLKVFGLVLVGAAMAVLAGAGTASATVLCESTTTPCSSVVWTSRPIFTDALAPRIETEFKNVECNRSTMDGFVTNAGGASATVAVRLETLSFSECNCEVTVLSPAGLKQATLEIHHISGTDNGTVKASGIEITTSCSTIFGTVHCIYATENTDLGTFKGGSFPEIDINGAELPRLSTSAVCSSKAKWRAHYEVHFGPYYAEPS